MTRSLLVLAVVGAVVAGCSGAPGAAQRTDAPTATQTPAPWPEAWAEGVCGAIEELGEGIANLRQAFDDGLAYDVDSAAEYADKASDDAELAEQWIEGVPAWAPGRSVAVYLTSAAESFRKATNLTKIAFAAVDPASLKVALEHLDKATYQMGRARTAVDALQAKTGFRCS